MPVETQRYRTSSYSIRLEDWARIRHHWEVGGDGISSGNINFSASPALLVVRHVDIHPRSSYASVVGLDWLPSLDGRIQSIPSASHAFKIPNSVAPHRSFSGKDSPPVLGSVVGNII